MVYEKNCKKLYCRPNIFLFISFDIFHVLYYPSFIVWAYLIVRQKFIFKKSLS